MGLSWKGWKLSDLFYGIIIPVVVVLVIIGFSQLNSLFGMESSGVVIGIVSEIEEMSY